MQTSSEYDSTGNYVTSETNEQGSTTKYAYDTNGNKTAVTDGNGNVTNYTYDTNGNVLSIKNGTSGNDYSYTGSGSVSKITHNGFSYSFNYDVFYNLVSTKIGNVTVASHTYDSNGNLTKTAFANGDYFEYTYDDYGNIFLITGETDKIAEMIYNKQGLVTKAVDYSNGETSYYYYTFDGSLESEYRTSSDGSLTHYIVTDSDGNTVEKTSVNGQTKTITTGTDKDGKSFVSNDGVTNETSTDDFGRTTQVRTVRSDGTLVFNTDYEYAGGKAENSTANLVSKYSQSYGSDSVLSYDYSYDNNGNITEIKQNGKLINKYTYDSLNELKEEYDYVNKFYINYSYDGAGNLQNKYEQVLDPTYGYPTGTQNGNTYEYTDTSWKDKLTKINGDNITYDANGNPLSYRDGMSFEWENGRILKKISTSDKSVQMSYDSNGMRTQKTVDGVKTNYYYDSNKNLIALVRGNDTLLFYYNSDGSATSFSYNGTMYFYVKNLQGDVVRIIDLSGTEVASYVYDAWGNIKDTKGVPTIREINPIRYRGYVYDTETSLYYLQSRYYDPFTGRFLNADVYADTQSGTPLSTNMFAYCENNAINKSDDEGKDAWWLQSPNSANGKGHTSLLLKEKSGYWWYFYWGPSSIQLLFLGTTSLKNINKNVRNQINYYNNDKKRPVMIRKLDYSENYTQAIQLKGHFEDSIKRIKKFINDNKYAFKYSVRYCALYKFRYTKKYKGKDRPYSYILSRNLYYNLLTNNCMQASVYYLKYGSLNKNNVEFKLQLGHVGVIPNNNINNFKKFGKWVTC